MPVIQLKEVNSDDAVYVDANELSPFGSIRSRDIILYNKIPTGHFMSILSQ